MTEREATLGEWALVDIAKILNSASFDDATKVKMCRQLLLLLVEKGEGGLIPPTNKPPEAHLEPGESVWPIYDR